MNSEKKTNIFKATNKLQIKVGTGTIDTQRIVESQTIIDKNEVDFAPLGLAILKKLEVGLDQTKDPSVPMDKIKAILTAPVMELKANAAIFHYNLIGNLANIMLHFLETIKTMDADAIEIVKAHHSTLHMIIVRQLKGDAGQAGKQLAAELQQACDRYYHKKISQ